MENRYCAFLRGVNVKGTTMKMDRLAASFSEMGFENIKTIQASGNVLFSNTHNKSQEELKCMIEEELSRYFDYEANVFIRNKEEIEEILTASSKIPTQEECHHYILLCDKKEYMEEIKAVFKELSPTLPEQFYTVSSEGKTLPEAVWIVPKGSTLSSEFGSKVLGSKKYKSIFTSRNRNTLEKVSKSL
ncbi:MAG: hypothetical protein K0R05_1742 [Anaerocolumna sp.]|jgi:uncharacterized protein (DUF1697 family)|nr:hypothetical protein [Anaerocolumna sp.]